MPGRRETLLAQLADVEAQAAALRVQLGMQPPEQHRPNVTEREALLVQAERVARMGSWRWNMATGDISWSDEMFRILGLPREVTPTADRFFAAIHPEDREAVTRVTRDGAATGSPEPPLDFRIRQPDGNVRQVRLETQLVQEPGGQPFLIGTILDTTERKQLEERLALTQRMEAVGTLAGGVAHDFNNYLAIITGHAEVLARALGEQHPGSASAQAISHASRSCADLTKRLLTMTREQPVESRPSRIDELTRRATPMLESLLSERASLHVSTPDSLPQVCADPVRIEQVLVNLVANARDAMPNGGELKVALSSGPAPEHLGLPEGDYVELRVEDEGVGMRPEVLERVFEPFFTTKDLGGGTGLGLATVYSIAQQMGGSVDVESAPDEGTRFSVYLPVHQGTAEVTLPKPAPVPAPPPPAQETVLVVEDHAQLRALVCMQLRGAGFQVLSAPTGQRALEIAQKEPVTVTLSDVIMPGMSGVEVVSELGSQHPGMRFVLMTGYSSEELEKLPSDSPATILRKPFNERELLAAIAER